jgi:uncharacterized membrane protein (UPF0127 family)
VEPWRTASCRGARAALELAAGEAAKRGIHEGMALTQVWRTEARRPHPHTALG